MSDNYQVRDASGNPVTFKSKDLSGVQLVQSVPSDAAGSAYSVSNPMSVQVAGFVAPDIQIGTVELKDSATDTRTKIGVSTTIVESDNALAVKDPAIGVTTGAAVVTDDAGTLQQYLRGLVKMVAAKIGITTADGDNATIGAKADTASTWYTSTSSHIALLKLAIAAFVGAGSHAFTYTSGVLTADAWTLLGTTRTKTYTYTAGVLTAESDWA